MLSLMAVKDVSSWNANNGWTGVDPGFSYQFLKPDGEATLEDYAAAGWDTGDVEQYLQAYRDTFFAETSLTYLRIPGTFEYWDIMGDLAGPITALIKQLPEDKQKQVHAEIVEAADAMRSGDTLKIGGITLIVSGLKA